MAVYTMKYTIRDLREDFPDDATCLEWLVNYLYPEGVFCVQCDQKTKHYPIKGRKVYSCGKCGWQVSPMKNTIFENTKIPLTDWFYAIFVMVNNKAGTSAKEIERTIGVSYPTAWRMMHKIREMMAGTDEPLKTEVELDETYFHANVFKRSSAKRRYGNDARRTGATVFGMLERGGRVKVFHVPSARQHVLMPIIEKHIEPGTLIHTDGWSGYNQLENKGYEHRTTSHGLGEYYREDSYTQTIESFWSTAKPRMRGTFRHVTDKYLQNYMQEFAWRYSHRNATSMFWALMGEVERPSPKP